MRRKEMMKTEEGIIRRMVHKVRRWEGKIWLMYRSVMFYCMTAVLVANPWIIYASDKKDTADTASKADTASSTTGKDALDKISSGVKAVAMLFAACIAAYNFIGFMKNLSAIGAAVKSRDETSLQEAVLGAVGNGIPLLGSTAVLTLFGLKGLE